MSDHFDSCTLHIAHAIAAILEKSVSRMLYLPATPFYTVSAVVTKLQRLGVTA